MNQPLKFLFKFPCRGREKMFFESLDSLNTNIRDKDNYFISLTLDTDDQILNNPDTIAKIEAYPNVGIEWGLSESKVHAINRNVPDYDFDVIICWSQDMFATYYSFDDIMRGYIMSVVNIREDCDFLIHFPEPDTKEILNVLYIATKDYYSRFNYIYHPSYKSLFCDNESMEVAQKLGRYYYIGIPGLYEHRNPAYHRHGIARDELFNSQQDFWETDQLNFTKRKSLNFDL